MRNLVGTLLSTAPLVHTVATPGGLLKRAKYCVRGLAFARHTRDWFAFLEAPEMAFIVKHNPCLFHKLQRPYLTRTLNTLQRLEVLKQHYKFVLRHFSAALISEVFMPAGKLLVELPMEKTGALVVRLYCSKMEKEGDFTLCLEMKETQKRIGTLSFSICRCEGTDKEIFVGGLQGDQGTREDLVVAITRGMYGLRPKAFLFYILQQLCDCWGIRRVRTVSDQMHIYRHFQSRRNVRASYDKFWVECGGTPAPNGTFALPPVFVPRDISTIRVNKRQLYRRRYAMLEGIREQLLSRLSGRKEIAGPELAPQFAARERPGISSNFTVPTATVIRRDSGETAIVFSFHETPGAGQPTRQNRSADLSGLESRERDC
jgi:uncharacterized protein